MTKSIPLTQGKFAIVDDEDYDEIARHKWYYLNGYAQRHAPRGVTRMHRVIAGTPPGMDTDHINGDGLDNRRSNLRVCTHSQNMANRGRDSTNTSGFKGVTWHKECRKWLAYTAVNRKMIHIGLFERAEDAARAYDREVVRIFGEFAAPNFPQERDHA